MSDSAPKPTPSAGVDVADLLTRLVKYLLEGLAVAIAAFVLPGKTLKVAVLDIYAPSVGASARTGAGFGIGANLVGFPRV